ncbi:MAG TPA: chemotaxis protein CheX [Sedimentisphaerales bacterium]|nr:chemotaxis protein CheX [Sedimentisphaerales bacterium]
MMNTQLCFEETLLEAAKEVLEMSAFMEVEVYTEGNAAIEGDSILGTLTFKGAMEGCLAIRCSVNCARNMAIAMLGMDPTESLSQSEIADSLGEVTNMVLGSFKARIQATIGNIEVSIPSVVMGQRLEGSLGEGASRAVINVVTAENNLIEIGLLYRAKH